MDIADFLNTIKTIGSEVGFENYYRGHSDTDFNLTPSIYREGLIDNEYNIFKETIVLTPHEFLNCKSTVEKLVKMQHYKVPTRLLDITSNPLVALYFACKKEKEKNGDVFFFQIPHSHIKFYDSDNVSVLANIAKMQGNIDIDIFATNSISYFNENSIAMEYLVHEIREEKPYFQMCINPKHLEEVFAIKVKLDNLRILKQNGAFLIFGINANNKRQAEIPHGWILKRITIPFEDKVKILKELYLIGINESTLFPEIENQAQHLINKYKKNIQ